VLLLIPLGSDEPRPRLPRATLALVGLNLLVFLLTSGAELTRGDAELTEIAKIAEYSIRGMPAATQERAARYSSPLAFVEKDALWPSEATSSIDRERLLACRDDYLRVKRSHPFYRFGFVPAELTLLRFFSHQFLHADFLHLLFNMLFLWTVGGLIETTLGSIPFVVCYLLAGIAAALAHAAAHPASAEPAIGASGAVAGIMGMCAVLHFRERIRVALVAGLGLAPRISLHSVPAAVLLGLWLVEQIFMASFRSSSLNVAFEAHLGGFAFGVVAAVSARLWLGRGSRPQTAPPRVGLRREPPR
jgi:membrane associated rhomboid family serine protease